MAIDTTWTNPTSTDIDLGTDDVLVEDTWDKVISNLNHLGGSDGLRKQATQAAIEAETNEDTYTRPDLLKHSPGVAKAWAKVPIAGTSFDASYNMTSVSRPATGLYNYVIAVDFSSANYAAIGMAEGTTHNATISAQAAGTLTLETRVTTSGSAANRINFVACFGDQ